jgi:DNA-binding NarL/FixJ family response regulator
LRPVEEPLEQIGRDVPNVLLVDIRLPGMSGTEGIRLLKERYPALPALVLTVYEDDERIFNALCAGACGYLLKSTPPVARRVIELFRDFRPPEKSDRKLTAHEARLLALLVDGHNLKTAAAEIGVSRATVAWHMRGIYEKLQVHSQSDAVAKALRAPDPLNPGAKYLFIWMVTG